jgi:hypothetical protein
VSSPSLPLFAPTYGSYGHSEAPVPLAVSLTPEKLSRQLAIPLMKSLNSILLTALGLALSTLAAQSANIKISSLPFAITAPGTYVVTGNLSSSEIQNVAAITISTSISGPVILDLKGFTLTGSGGDSIGIGIGLFAGTNVFEHQPDHHQERYPRKLRLWSLGGGGGTIPRPVRHNCKQYDH